MSIATATLTSGHRGFPAPASSQRVRRWLIVTVCVVALHVVALMPARLPIAPLPAALAAASMTVRLVTDAPMVPAADPPTMAPAPPVVPAATPVAAPSSVKPFKSATAAAHGEPAATNAAAAAGSAVAAASPPRSAVSGLAAAPEYRAGAELDPGPSPLGEIEPVYPARAGQQQGTVVLRLLINERGVVDNVAVVRASPAGFFEEAAVEAFAKATFSPGRWLGIPVKSELTIEIEFTPINRGAVSGRTY